MQDDWTLKVAAFLPKIIMLLPKLFSLLITLIAIAGGIILALVLSDDIDKDGFIKINRGVVRHTADFTPPLFPFPRS